MVHDDAEIVLQRINRVDHDLWFPQWLVELAPTLYPLPVQLVPSRDLPSPTVDSVPVNLEVGADALDDREGRAVPIRQRGPFLTRLLASHQIQDAAPAASQLLLSDAREHVPADPAQELDRLFDRGPDVLMAAKCRHDPVEAGHGRSELVGHGVGNRGLPGSRPTRHDDEPLATLNRRGHAPTLACPRRFKPAFGDIERRGSGRGLWGACSVHGAPARHAPDRRVCAAVRAVGRGSPLRERAVSDYGASRARTGPTRRRGGHRRVARAVDLAEVHGPGGGGSRHRHRQTTKLRTSRPRMTVWPLWTTMPSRALR